MGRGMTIAVLCAAGVGSVGGGLLALQVSPESSSTQSAARSIGDHATTLAASPKPPVTAQPITPSDPHAALVAQIQAVLRRVPEWTRTHPRAACPDVATLGVTAIDPWGREIELTCTDQPADQILGAISAGPDGIRGNLDDVESWNLGPTVTQLVQGRRWTSPSTAATPPLATKPARSKRRNDSSSNSDRGSTQGVASTPGATSTAAPPIDAGDGIPTRR
jgi:hypothetical protein